MKKIYFYVILRKYRKEEQIQDETFLCEVIEYNEGYVIFQDNESFNGYLTMDLIEGSWDKSQLYIEIKNFYPKEIRTYYRELTDEFEIPNSFFCYSYDDEDEIIEIEFQSRISNPVKQKNIEETLKRTLQYR